jgi:hypothetical protein
LLRRFREFIANDKIIRTVVSGSGVQGCPDITWRFRRRYMPGVLISAECESAEHI